LDNPSMYLPTNLKIDEVPWQPWARAVYDYRQAETTKDDPHVRCKPSGGPRMYHTPYGHEFIEVPEEKKIYILSVGGPHSWRVVYMDGREHPKDLDPTFSGHSVGHWEGDTLVVDTVGFNEKFWLTREGIPHTSALHLTTRCGTKRRSTIRAHTHARGAAAGTCVGRRARRCTSTSARRTTGTLSTCSAARGISVRLRQV